MSFKPDGYTKATPYPIVDGASRTIDFLTRGFGAADIHRFTDEQDRVRHAEVRISDTAVMLSDGLAGWPPIPAHVHV